MFLDTAGLGSGLGAGRFEITTGLGKSSAVCVGMGKPLLVGLGNGVFDATLVSPGNKRCHVGASTTLFAVKPAACLNCKTAVAVASLNLPLTAPL